MTEELTIVKRGSCETLNRQSTVKYELGRSENNDCYVRIMSCSGGGFHSREWVSLTAIYEILEKTPDRITSIVLFPLYKGKSVNTPGYCTGFLVHAGLLERVRGKQRVYQLSADFKERVAKLLSGESKTNTTRKKATAKKKRAPARAKAR